jgi:predicted phosphodiesterase
MKIAIVSDIHANLQAWRAVLLDIRSLKADLIICLGDVVGYGPEPAEVVASVWANVNYCLLGNHDAAVCGKIEAGDFSETAARSLAWTKTRVGPKAINFLSLLPLTISAGGFRCSHGEFSVPARFNYVFEPEDAAPSWEAVSERLLFVGHTHQAGIFVIGQSRLPHRITPRDFALEDDKRYLINVGSVGQPRGSDPRASYCLYDVAAATVYWRRTPFDLDAFRDALRRNNLPESDHHFLRHDPLAGQQSARELAGFHPSDRPEDAARDAVAVQNIDLLRRNVRRWRAAAWSLIAGCLLAGLALAWFWFYRLNHPAEIRGASLPIAPGPGGNLLRLPPAASGPGEPIAGWTIRLADGRRQAAAVTGDFPADPVFELQSELPEEEITLGSDPIAVLPGARLQLQALFKKAPDFSGYAVVTVKLTRRAGVNPDNPAGDSPSLIVREPNLPRQGGWRAVKHTFQVPANADQLEIQVGGKFKGGVEVKGLTLVRKD